MKLLKVHKTNEAMEEIGKHFLDIKIYPELVDITEAHGRVIAEDIFFTNFLA